MPFSGVMCARGIASSPFQIPAVYCHFHGDASPSITCRKNIGADSFWSAGNVFEGLKHKILPVDRLIANLSRARGEKWPRGYNRSECLRRSLSKPNIVHRKLVREQIWENVEASRCLACPHRSCVCLLSSKKFDYTRARARRSKKQVAIETTVHK